MSQAGKFLRRTAEGYAHWCPACEEMHHIWTDHSRKDVNWTFNGDLEKPSFSPSVKITGVKWDEFRDQHTVKDGEGTCCHYFVTDGDIRYCNDCTHALKGQTVHLTVLSEDMT